MPTATSKYMDVASYQGKPSSKVDGLVTSFKLVDHERDVINIRGQEHKFSTHNTGFAVYEEPRTQKLFTDEGAIRSGYYGEVEAMLRNKLPGVNKVVIFDHTIRQKNRDALHQPVQQVHVDQTPGAAEIRIRRLLPKDEAEELLKGGY